ncbi:MAG: DUF4149 domain-containing protein [Deltaproteobacteria bacterium]|nr:DUF4149 domain-containing protein [Deltaproteobacteria bacterium]
MLVFLSFLKFTHLLSLLLWVGSIFFFSFIAAPIIFKALPREKAGDLIGQIFPKYWILGYLLSLLALFSLIGTFLIERSSSFASSLPSYLQGHLDIDYPFPLTRFIIILLMVFIAYYSGLVIGKKAVKIKALIRAEDNAKKKEALRGTFKKIHAVSAILNMSLFFLGLVLVHFTALKL